MRQFQRTSLTPMIAKGATYDGIKADALAATSGCFDGTRWVIAVNIWNIATAKWYLVFFTSTDKWATWTYVPGSLRSPQGTDYLIGNGGMAWFNNRYYISYSHYLSGPGGITLQWSTDLLNWTTVADPLTVPSGTGLFDSSLVVNTNSGLLELGYVKLIANVRTFCMADSPDGSNNFTDRGAFMTGANWNLPDFGEHQPFYIGRQRLVTFDGTPNNGHRLVCLAISANADTNWVHYGSVMGSNPLNAAESIQSFDSWCPGVVDLSDGRGPVLHMIRSGGDVVTNGDNTDSNLYHDWMTSPVATGGVVQGIIGGGIGSFIGN